MPAASMRDHFLHMTPGKIASLGQITDANGKFKVLAIDQSGSFKDAFKKLTGRDATDAEIRDAKLEMTRVIGTVASSVLLDVTYAAAQSIVTGSLPRGVGLVVRLEKGCKAGEYGYEEIGWNVAKIKKMGGSAVKLLVYMNTDDALYTTSQIDFVKRTFDACRENDIILMTEELSFPKPGETKDSPEYNKRKVQNILKSTELIGPHTDILKLEYPGEENLAELNRLAVRPWVLLSAGVDFEIFEKQVESAMKAGCSGIMAGRAVFKDWFKFPNPADRLNFLKTTGVERFKKLCDLVDKYALSWTEKAGVTREEIGKNLPFNWYSSQAVGTAAGTY